MKSKQNSQVPSLSLWKFEKLFLGNLLKAVFPVSITVVVSIPTSFLYEDSLLREINVKAIFVFLLHEAILGIVTFFVVRFLGKSLGSFKSLPPFRIIRLFCWTTFSLLLSGIPFLAYWGLPFLESLGGKIVAVGVVLFILLCYWIRLSFASYMYALTDFGLRACIHFSWRLTKGKSWFVFKAILILLIPLFFIPQVEFFWIFPLLYGLTLFDYLKTDRTPISTQHYHVITPNMLQNEKSKSRRS